MCYQIGYLYVFPTQELVKAIDRNKGKLQRRSISRNSDDIVTAAGFLVPPAIIRRVRAHKIDKSIPRPHRREPNSVKARAAEALASKMIQEGTIYIASISDNPTVEFVEDKREQSRGVDFIVDSEVVVQVKCDYSGGHKSMGGTGSLFVEDFECNPYQSY